MCKQYKFTIQFRHTNQMSLAHNLDRNRRNIHTICFDKYSSIMISHLAYTQSYPSDPSIKRYLYIKYNMRPARSIEYTCIAQMSV